MGGAIFNTGILSIENSSFINNDPKEYGDVILNDTGVINNDFNSIKLPMNTCKFKGIRESAGGKLYISDSVLMNLFPVYPYDFISNWGDLTICDTIAQFDKIDENISQYEFITTPFIDFSNNISLFIIEASLIVSFKECIIGILNNSNIYLIHSL